jgi:hypothetical protein
MYTLSFQKYFTKGFLKGITVSDKLSFPTANDAMIWIDSILNKERQGKLNYKLINFTM